VTQTDVPPDLHPTPREPQQIVVAAPSRSLLGTAVQAVVLLLLLSILAAVVLVLFAVVAFVNVPGQVAGGVGSQLGGVAAQASRAVSGAQQALQNATDPNHPPSGLTYDNELASLQVWHVGAGRARIRPIPRCMPSSTPSCASRGRRDSSASLSARTPTPTTSWSTKAKRSASATRCTA